MFTVRQSRFAWRLLAAPLLVLLLTGCTKRDDDLVTLRFWNGFTGPDGRTMLRIVKEFNRTHPSIRVRMQRIPWGLYYNKLFVAGIGRRAPEVFVIHSDSLERFIQAHIAGRVDNLVALPGGIDSSDIVANAWQAVEDGGSHYGMPLDVHLLGMYYNKALFREAGLVDDRDTPILPRTREEFITTLKALTRDLDGDGRPDEWGMVFTWLRTNVSTIMKQWGGEFLNDTQTACTLNNPENVAALQFCVDLIQKYKVAPPLDLVDAWVGVRQGKVGLAFEGIYMLGDIERLDTLDMGTAAMPWLGPHRAVWANSHTLCIREGLDPRVRTAAWQFVEYLSDQSLDWAQAGQVPVRKSLLDSDRFKEMDAQRAFAEALPYIFYFPRVPWLHEFQTEFDYAVEQALRGSLTPQEALDQATTNINEIIERYNALLATSGSDGS